MNIINNPDAVINPNDLTISIVGKPGIGKTALALLIIDCLKRMELPVSSFNGDSTEESAFTLLKDDPEEVVDICLHIREKGVNIHITEEHIQSHKTDIPVMRATYKRKSSSHDENT